MPPRYCRVIPQMAAAVVESRIRAALWGMIAGDALAAPTHWYYGGSGQVRADYGPKGIAGYTKPVPQVHPLAPCRQPSPAAVLPQPLRAANRSTPLHGAPAPALYGLPAQMMGSIMAKSNVNGGGRGAYAKGDGGQSIIGDVINHGKYKYWDPAHSYHYHGTLQQGEPTLEAQLVRVLMRSVAATGGKVDPGHF
eukprot:gene3728-694_t